MKFIRENKAITLSLFIVVLSLVLLAIPKSFAHLGVDIIKKGANTYHYYMSGYEWMFGTVKKIGDAKTAIGSAVPSGIAALSLLALSFCGLCFSKKSSFVLSIFLNIPFAGNPFFPLKTFPFVKPATSFLTSLALITVAILFFASSAATAKAYPDVYQIAENGEFSNMSWAPYVIGALTLIAGGLMMYRTILVMRDEVKRPTQAKGTSYSYLHK